MALPGVRAEQLEVRFEGDTLVVAGERTLPTPRGAGAILPPGDAARLLRAAHRLPAGHYELGRRELADGCLTLTLRKLG